MLFITKNKKVSYNFEVLDSYEAGISLTGSEVKSIRNGKISIEEGWVDIQNNQAILKQVMISTVNLGGFKQIDQVRARSLLLHKKQIDKLARFIENKGYSIVPTQVYLKNGLVKIKIACVKGKKIYDKRQDQRKKEANRKIDAALKYKQR